MQEVVLTRLPLLAWRGQNGQFYLIYDDLRVGELSINADGTGTARYHDLRWTIEKLDSQRTVLRKAGQDEPLGSLELSQANGPEEGEIRLAGQGYPCLRDRRKLPPRITITQEGGRPLLQFRQETPSRGRIQIDDQTAAASPNFEILVLWGLYLYMTAEPIAQTPVAERSRPTPRKTPASTNGHGGGTATRRRSREAEKSSGTPPPAMPPEDKYTGGNDEGHNEQTFWVSLAIGLFMTISLFGALRGIQRAVSKR